MRPIAPSRPRRAYTLVELMVTMGIISIVTAIVLPFFLFSTRSLFHAEQKLLINGDIRGLTNSMMENAREANYALLYRAFHAQTSSGGIGVSRDHNGDGFITALDRLAAGQSGDFVVLVYTRDNGIHNPLFYDGIPNNEPANLVQVTRLVGYWVAPNRVQPTNRDGTARRALYMFDTDRSRPDAASTTWTTPWNATFPVSLSASVSVESLLPPATASDAISSAYATLLINDLEGRGDAGLNFVNFGNRSIGVKSRVLHGNRAKRVTNTYNFAITPRG
jgi:prepilin-type N-terminal cleavage/methylation domain-containing protein